VASQTPVLSMLANPVGLERFWMEYRKNSEISPPGIPESRSTLTGEKKKIHSALLQEAIATIARRPCIRILLYLRVDCPYSGS